MDLIGREPSRRYYIFVSNRFPSLTSFQGWNFARNIARTKKLSQTGCLFLRGQTRREEYICTFSSRELSTECPNVPTFSLECERKNSLFFGRFRIQKNFIGRRANERVEFDRSVDPRAGKFNETVIVRYADPPSFPARVKLEFRATLNSHDFSPFTTRTLHARAITSGWGNVYREESEISRWASSPATRRETAPIYPRPAGGYPISSRFSPTVFSIGIFLGCVAANNKYTLSKGRHEQGERIDGCILRFFWKFDFEVSRCVHLCV